MRVIGYRKSGIAIVYILCLIFLVPFSAAVVLSSEWFFIFFPILMAAICIYTLIGYFKTPCEAIIHVDDDTIEIAGKETIKLADVTSVSFKRARAKGVRYKWGSVTVNTKYGSCKVNYIADCEDVANEITRLAERAM